MSMKKLAGQTAVYGISTVLYKALNYFMGLFYLTHVMNTAEYGVTGDMYSIIPFVMIILTFGLESGYFRFAGKAGGAAQKRELFATTWGFTSLLAVMFMALVLAMNKPIAGVMRYSEYPSYVWLVGLIIMLDVMSAIPFAVLREQGRARRFLTIRIVSVLVNVVLCFAFYSGLPRLAEMSGFFEAVYDPAYGAGYAFVANLIGSLVALAMLTASTGRVAPRISRGVLGAVLVYSMPLLISGIAGAGNEFIDRQMIKYLMPENISLSSLGIFTSVTRLGAILLMFTQVYRYGAEPYFLSSFKNDDFERRNAEAMKYYLIVGTGLFLLITLFAEPVSMLMGREFRGGVELLPLIAVSNLLSGVVLNLSFWYKQRELTKFAIIITGSGFVVTAVLGVWLVPILGMWGAAIARLVCEVVMVLISYGLGRRHCPVPYDMRRIGEYVLLGGAVFGLALLTAKLPGGLKYLCNFALLGTYGLYFVWREKIDVAGLLKLKKH